MHINRHVDLLSKKEVEKSVDDALSKLKILPPKAPLSRIMEEGNLLICSQCGSTMERRFNIFGLFQFGKIIRCHNPHCKSVTKRK